MSSDDFSEHQKELKRLLAESKAKHVTNMHSIDLTQPSEENVRFFRSLKEVLEKEGALANDIVGEDGYTAGEMYKNVLAALEKLEKAKGEKS